ncbi:hypothetical protein Pmani_007494 [Petrolisthes manimaculis]|uniref:Uncharacterized protein n=1 Tax=Petrolisthes manimaculis TaxID=1843537 RepID=A0AAE1QAH9_9EUCA|nr:hypothetical protein Pmani_007494 [Petrolisthes manimaculis]
MNRQENLIAQRGQIIGLREAGHSVRAIGHILGLSPTTVAKWIRRWNESGDLRDAGANLEDAQLDGNPADNVDNTLGSEAIASRPVFPVCFDVAHPHPFVSPPVWIQQPGTERAGREGGVGKF